LGDTGQDIGLYNNDLAFVVLNYSNKIEVINRYYMAHCDSGLSNLDSLLLQMEGYVTNWGNGGSATDDYVAVVNLPI
jgi:hypothetical protein